MRRPLFLAQNMKQVVPEILRNLIIVDHLSCILLVFKRAFKQVQRAIISVVHQVLEVVLEWHPQLVPIVGLANLELCLLEVVVKVLETPCLWVPCLCAA